MPRAWVWAHHRSTLVRLLPVHRISNSILHSHILWRTALNHSPNLSPIENSIGDIEIWTSDLPSTILTCYKLSYPDWIERKGTKYRQKQNYPFPIINWVIYPSSDVITFSKSPPSQKNNSVHNFQRHFHRHVHEK